MEAPTDVDRLVVLPEERIRILAGDYSPLHRSDMPKCKRGEVHVLSWSRRSAHARDGHVFIAEREPLKWLTVKRVTRRSKGGWSVSFEFGYIERPLYMLQGSPLASGQKRESLSEDSPLAHGYTPDPRRGVDGADIVPLDYQTVLVTKAKAKFAELRGSENRRLNVEQLSTKLRALHKRAERTGADLTEELAAVSQALAAAEAKLEKAA